MRRLNTLVIRGPNGHLSEFLEQVESRLDHGWRRDRELEARLQQMGAGGRETYCFRCDAADDRPAAALWLRPRGPGEWGVSHVVPTERQSLTEAEYNGVLDEFETRFIAPVGRGAGVDSEILPPPSPVEEFLSPEAFRLLRAFSKTANRTQLDRLDRRRWEQFLLQAHRDETILDGEALAEWLESEGWHEEARRELIHDYDAARSLLASYDEEQQG